MPDQRSSKPEPDGARDTASSIGNRADTVAGCHPQEAYAQLRALRAKKRALTARTLDELQRAEAWVQRWGRLLRGFHTR